MHNLKELQSKLLLGIMENNLSLDFVKQNGDIDVVDRLQIHRDTVLENFVSSLKIIYPGVWRLVGEECARGVSLAYSHNLMHIRNRDDMNSFGEDFPEFLRNFASTNHLEYLADFAMLEWLRARSYEAMNESFLSIEDMQDFFINSDEGGRLELNSSIYFLKSRFPLMNIQELLDNPEINELIMDDSDSYIIVCRLQGKIETLYLLKNQWQFLYNLNNGDAIGKAIECFADKEVESELSTMIQLLLSKRMIKRIVE